MTGSIRPNTPSADSSVMTGMTDACTGPLGYAPRRGGGRYSRVEGPAS